MFGWSCLCGWFILSATISDQLAQDVQQELAETRQERDRLKEEMIKTKRHVAEERSVAAGQRGRGSTA